ncbi:MAG: DUF3575 domain-containing protein [Mucinivorans sp.]
MKKILLLCLSIMMLTGVYQGAKAQIPSANKLIDSAFFHYRAGSIILYKTYSSNENALDVLARMVASHRTQLVTGRAHFEILSYIPSYNVGVLSSVNFASLQASVVRAYLKTQYGIAHAYSTFAIDTTQNMENVVQLQLVSGPIPQYANQDIFYSHKGSSWSINQAFAAYRGGIPYASYRMINSQRNEPLYAHQDFDQSAEEPDSASLSQLSERTLSSSSSNEYEFKVYDANKKLKDSRSSRLPVFGFKTNLLGWVTAMPNLGVEFYFGKHFSLGVDGQYSWLSRYLKNDLAYYHWGANAEFRYWFGQGHRYDRWYLGVYGNVGQYDFKFAEVGNQGEYYSVGLTAGYVLPVGRHFNVEFGLGCGYVNSTNTAYVWDEAQGDFISKDPSKVKATAWSILPTKLRIALLWKF